MKIHSMHFEVPMKNSIFAFTVFACVLMVSAKIFALDATTKTSSIGLNVGGEFSVMKPSDERVNFGSIPVTLHYKDYNRPVLGFDFSSGAFSLLANWSNQDDVNYYFLNPRYSAEIIQVGKMNILGNIGPSIRIGHGSIDQASYTTFQFGVRFGVTGEMNITDTAFVTVSPINLGYEFETYQKYEVSGTEVSELTGWKSLSWLTYSLSVGAGLRF